jgi:hypothetical protein
MTNDLWTETQADDLDVPIRRRAARELNDMRHIGCPLAWFMAVFPIMRSKNELAVALHIYRLRSIRPQSNGDRLEYGPAGRPGN